MGMVVRTLVLSDGSLPGLLACAAAREGATVASAEGSSGEIATPAVFAFAAGSAPTASQRGAVMRHAEAYSLEVIGESAAPGMDAAAGEAETLGLMAAAHAGVRRGCLGVTWPATGAAGDSLDLDRIAAITDRAFLVGRLVAMDAAAAGAAGLRLETPYADLTDRQVAELAMDMDVPVAACWWWGNDRAGAEERARWMRALEAVGWTAPTRR